MTSLAVLVLALAQAADDAAARKAIEKFTAGFKSKDVEARVAAVTELGKVEHERTVDKLGQVLKVDVKEVRLAAAQALGNVTEPKPKTKAVLALSNGIGPNASSLSVVLAIVESLEKIQAGVGHSVLKALLPSPNADVAKGAIDAAGEIRDKGFIVPLIDLAQRLEAAARNAQNVGPGGRSVTGGGLLGGAGGPGVDPEAPKRAQIVLPACYKALGAITGEKFQTPKDWADWYRKRDGRK